ncbi:MULTISPECIES: hypothetical protein [Actinokineospora]|uniref:Uncharacterized protein n=1 Tax=Actinokineospora fastidiosa TaxID=1816 RepID=A0A918GJ32_9PSEU|nr:MULTISPECIES: hypothetical protein [Actinokineospora]UVS80934.1 hypothetical protein Actkin_04686 [Actinokineospora sp. UTMC 2448]GGS38326.1 hypothetical protein GCM10010171_36560 [Actinokineospora fastidiosa]
MLYIVLVLVLAALGMLVVALSTASTLWAWLSIAISLAGAAVLVMDWLGNRRRRAAAADRAVDEAEAEPEDSPDDEPVVDAEPDDLPEDEPAEEQTDASDLLVVAGLSVEVRVVDERPRYHLARCSWLSGRPTLALPVSEARQLGFTPCAVCTPDSVLAARHRHDQTT